MGNHKASSISDISIMSCVGSGRRACRAAACERGLLKCCFLFGSPSLWCNVRIIKLIKKIFIYFRESAHTKGPRGERRRGRESQADATLSMEPDSGLDLTTRSWPRLKPVLIAQPAEPPRCPKNLADFKGTIWWALTSVQSCDHYHNYNVKHSHHPERCSPALSLLVGGSSTFFFFW